MAAENAQNLFVNPDVSVKLEEMWNNKEFSDTLFLVNECQFYASSHLVSVMSGVLKGIIDTHFQHCGDREIRIGEVKLDESFSVVLKFIHGIGINLEEMDKKLLCDVLNQAERFQLNSCSKKLKSYLSGLDNFEIDSLVVLINTAKKFEINDLYEKLIIFAYQNADQLVKHESFVDLKYDVLSEMLKADNFFAPEIDILVGALKWHGNNLDESGYDEELKLNFKESEEVLHVGNKTPTVVDDNASEVAEKVSSQPHDKEDEEMDSASGVAEKNSSQTHDEEMNNDSEVAEMDSLPQSHDKEDEEMDNTSEVAEMVSSQPYEEDEEIVHAASELSVQKESSSLSSNVDNKPTSSNAVDAPNVDVVKNFSEKILKSLIALIRVKQVSVMDFQIVNKLDLYKQYKDFFEDFSLYSQSSKVRVPHAESSPVQDNRDCAISQVNSVEASSSVVTDVCETTRSPGLIIKKPPISLEVHCEVVHNVTKKFTLIISNLFNYWFTDLTTLAVHSDQDYDIASLKWRAQLSSSKKSNSLSLYLECNTAFNCIAEGQVTLVSNFEQFPNLIYPMDADNWFWKLNYCSSENKKLIATFKLDSLSSFRQIYAPKDVLTVYVNFQYIHNLVREIKEEI